MTVPLAGRLRAATKELHTVVERAGVMRPLLRGELPRTDYLRLLRNLHPIYHALEAGLAQHAAHPQLQPLLQASLQRQHALVQDLDALHGPGWAQRLSTAPAATAYATHLQQLSASRPPLLAAHVYVRYLGDLNGGQMLSRIVAKGLGLAPGAGLSFYDFGPADQVAGLGSSLRQALDRIAPDEAAATALVDEACSAFVRHRDLFEQLAQPVALH